MSKFVRPLGYFFSSGFSVLQIFLEENSHYICILVCNFFTANIAKTMTSNGKQFTVTREMLTAVARDQRWPDVLGISARFSKFAFVLFCCITNHLMTGPLGNSH